MGCADAAKELLDQKKNEFDVFVVALGSEATNAGLLAVLRGSGLKVGVIGCCVGRAAALQGPRIDRVLQLLADLYSPANNLIIRDIGVWDGALSPGYGRIGPKSLRVIKLMTSKKGLFLDPVYTAKSLSAIPSLLEIVDIPKRRQSVLRAHRGPSSPVCLSGSASIYAWCPRSIILLLAKIFLFKLFIVFKDLLETSQEVCLDQSSRESLSTLTVCHLV